jgi:hypothetical protein
VRSAALNCLTRSPTRLTETRLQLFLNDLGVLDHGDTATLGQFAFKSDVLTTILGELIVDWLVFANHQICFPIAYDADRPAALDALCPARLAMFLADGIVIDVAHHIDHFAGHFFGSSRVVAVLLRDRQRRARQTCNEDRSHRNSQDGRFAC